MTAETLEDLRTIARRIRELIIRMTAEASSGHYMSSLSCVEILVSLFFCELRCNPRDPRDPDRDRFILSKGHAAPALYAVMAERGYFPEEDLSTLRRCQRRLQGHPVMHRLPGLDASSGSLGQGLSTGVGMALAAKLDGRPTRVVVLLGDGECQEGQVWEAAMAGAHYRLDNLTAIIDRNRMQISGSTEDVMALGDLPAKFSSFGWQVIPVNGHDFGELLKSYRQMKSVRGCPVAIIAETVKGCGIPFIEGNLKYHTQPLTPEELAAALQCLR
jgi:transketolase